MKSPKTTTRVRFLHLLEVSQDRPLSAPEEHEFNALLTAHPALKNLLANSLLIDAEIRRDPRLLAEMHTSTRPGSAPRNIIPIAALAAAACLFLGLLIFQLLHKSGAPEAQTVATLTHSTHCKWASSTLPTAEGSRMAAGKLELVEGLATVVFDSGAQVSLEAPATLEILDEMNARLLSGTLVADVPKNAIGFTIDTQSAKVVDLGTRFGLSTDENGKYLVQVIEGLVEVGHKGENESVLVTEGKSLDRGLLASKKEPLEAIAEPTRWQPDPTTAQEDGWIVLPTSFGAGKDTFVTSAPDTESKGSAPFVRVKHTTIQPNLNRVAFLTFDISEIDPTTLTGAELVLHIEPSDLGFASLVPDSQFTVYGLTNQAADFWNESSLTWKNAPALDPTFKTTKTPDPSQTTPLGTFEITQGTQSGTCKIKGSALLDFIRSDTNSLLTFLIFRETDETDRAGLVHAFTSKENASAPPPQLRLKTP